VVKVDFLFYFFFKVGLNNSLSEEKEGMMSILQKKRKRH